MLAMRLYAQSEVENNPLQLGEVNLPKPGSGQIRVAVDVCGVCHTDLHTIEGDLTLPRLPLTPGHQIVGVVDACAEDARRFSPGARVGIGWLNTTCGICQYCQNGMENLCPNAKFTGLDVDGGYAEYVLVDEQFAFELPDALSNEEASPLLCAGIIGFRSLRLSGIKPGGKLGLYGFGASAHLTIQVARYWGCQVYVFTRKEEHQQHARELGAVWVGNAQEGPAAVLDAAITFAPAGWLIPIALGHLRPGGTLAVNAIHMSPIPSFSYEKLYGERVLRSVANFTRQDAQDFLKLAAEIPIRSSVERFPITDANQALRRLKDSEIRGAAVLDVGSR
jgi:alcohol dehydrogenase, propanol-preferring